MSEGDLTPPAGTGIWEVLNDRLNAMHARVNEIRSIQIEVCGRSGRNGKLQQARDDMSKMTDGIVENQKTIEKLGRRVDGMGVRLGVLVAIASFVAATAGAVVVKLVLGAQ